MTKKNLYTTLSIENPETEEIEDISVIFHLHFYPGRLPSFFDPIGEEDEYDFEIRHYEGAGWVTRKMVEEALSKIELREFVY